MGTLLSEGKQRLRLVRPDAPAVTKHAIRAEPLGDEEIITREPVKLFGFTLWCRTVRRPTLNTRMRRMIGED